jgi:hypothetical protein
MNISTDYLTPNCNLISDATTKSTNAFDYTVSL